MNINTLNGFVLCTDRKLISMHNVLNGLGTDIYGNLNHSTDHTTHNHQGEEEGNCVESIRGENFNKITGIFP